MRKLNQVIAIEKGVKARFTELKTKVYHAFQKPVLFNGYAKQYEKVDEEAGDLPPESQLVQLNADQLLQDVADGAVEYFDIVAAKDMANCNAKADVVLDGVTLMEQVPATFLLFLEKQLKDMETAFKALPVLDAAQDWSLDGATSLYKSDKTRTQRTEKMHKPVVLYPATPEHPAQTQLVVEAKTVGYWVTTKHSGAVTAERRKVLVKRVQELQKAVKTAREAANAVDAPPQSVGKKVFDYLLGE